MNCLDATDTVLHVRLDRHDTRQARNVNRCAFSEHTEREREAQWIRAIGWCRSNGETTLLLPFESTRGLQPRFGW